MTTAQTPNRGHQRRLEMNNWLDAPMGWVLFLAALAFWVFVLYGVPR